MRIFNFIVEPSLRSLQPWTHFKIHGYGKGNPRHLVWGKLSVNYGPVQYCEECEKETGLNAVCDACYENNYCECGRKLCIEEGSSPGDGFCARCR